MRASALICIGLLACCFVLLATADDGQQVANPGQQVAGGGQQVAGGGQQVADGGQQVAGAGQKDAKAGKADPDAVSTWRIYSAKCAGSNFDPKKTTPAECAGLSGKLCSNKAVKCSAATTDFLDAAGNVVATGTNQSGLYCPKDGDACSVA